MNTRYMFRGKRVDDGEWVIGQISHYGDSLVIIGEIVEWDEEYTCHEWWYKVNSDTVGQCTGLKDKNGKLIFEGDILNWKNEYWGVEWVGDMCKLELSKYRNGKLQDAYCLNCEHEEDAVIIGNIYDNPRLLG